MHVVEIPAYQECWTLDKAAGKAALLDTTSDPQNPRVAEYTYDEATRMIRLARIMGASPRRRG